MILLGIRTLLAVLWLFLVSFLGCFLCLVRWKNPTNTFYIAKGFSIPILWILGIKMIRHNFERLNEQHPCLYLANHQHNLDVATYGSWLPYKVVSIGKRELQWIPFFGWVFYLSGHILLDRKNRKKAINTVNATTQVLQDDRSIWIFPEGTRQPNGLGPFKKGAFYMALDAKVPIQPVVMNTIKNVLRPKKLRLGDLHIKVIDPIMPTEYEGMNVEQLSDLVRSRMEKEINVLDKLVLTERSHHPQQ